MRIQHNIMAMSAYRNYNNNTSALSKNLEKLSSGYKINRAGDDAAGLAISEKMRAQITGLSAAQKNVKDGISLVKTAEGAMQEIHDMLNRMDYLATQSANGTYQDEVDREALQKEVNQLNQEIDRIAESANFNGIKLLDGTWDTGAAEKAQKDIDAAQAKIANPEVKVEPTALTADDVKSLMLEQSANNNPADAADGVGKKTILETDGKGEIVPSFKVSLDGITHVVKDKTDTTKNITVEITDATGTAKQLKITEEDIATILGVDNGDTVSSADLAKVIAAKTTTNPTLDGVDYKVTAKDDTLVFTADANSADIKNAHFNVTIGSTVKQENVDPVAASYTTDAITYTAKAGGAADGDSKVTVSYTDANGAAKSVDVSFTVSTGQTTMVGSLKDALAAKTELTDLFDISVANDGKITFTAKEEGANKGEVTNATITNGANDTAVLGTNPATVTAGADGYTTGLDGYSNFGTQDIKVNVAGTKDELASTTLDLSGKLKDGTRIKLGDDEYVIAVGPDSAYKDAEGAVVVSVNANATEAEIASALTDAADSNGTFTVGHEVGTAQITLKQKAEVKEDTDMSTMDKFASYIGVSVIDDNAIEAAKKDVVAAAEKDLAKAQEAAKNAAGAKALQLQIGDTSDSYNQLGVGIGSMKTTALGVDGLSISTAEDAAKAIQTIKDAINYVSSVRGDLGAYQNRLEHTGNNLSVMAENIQDAESTIRDTDVAEEMMGYVKNNILVQSAQAMLAQANQVPQGVLQLLG